MNLKPNDFRDSFTVASIDVIKAVCNLDISPTSINGSDYNRLNNASVASVIGLTSPKHNGSIALSFPETTFLQVLSRMLGEEQKTFSHDLSDAAGEILNMIFCAARKTLNQKECGITPAIPTVICGNKVVVNHLGKTPVTYVQFSSLAGQFHLEIAVV